MKRFLICICSMLSLTGCTDIHTRLLPMILAVDTAKSVQFAAQTSQDSEIISAQAETALQIQNALRNASGAEVSTGHLSMLAISGNPCGVLQDYFQTQILAPTCSVLYVPTDACSQLKNGNLPEPTQLQAAVETGMLPERTADIILADLWGGSGITAFCTPDSDDLTLALWSSEACCGTLSTDACRGLALLGKRRKSFIFAVNGTTYRLTSDTLQIRLTQNDTLKIEISGTVATEPPLTEAAAARLSDMLTAALKESALAYGADLLFLREHAIRCSISAARSCSQDEWRELLRTAECSVVLDAQISRNS